MHLVDESPLISPWQHTLARESLPIAGATLRGHPATIIFKPSAPDTGRVVHVTHQGKAVGCITLVWQNARSGGVANLATWTEATDPLARCTLGVVEHMVAALVLAGPDNLTVHLDYPDQLPKTPSLPGRTRLSLPLFSGTSQEYLTALHKAGLQRQSARRHVWTVKAPQHFVSKDGQCRLELLPRTTPGWSLEALNANAQSGIVSDHAIYHIPQKTEETRPVPQRTFTPGDGQALVDDLNLVPPVVSLNDVVTARPPQLRVGACLAYRAVTIGAGGKVWGGRKFDFAVVVNPLTRKPLDEQSPMQNNEQIRHRLYDATADIFGFGLIPNEPWTTWPRVDARGENLRHRYGDEIRSWMHGLFLAKQLIIH